MRQLRRRAVIRLTLTDARDHSTALKPRVRVRGKAPKTMRNKEDYWEVVEVVPGAGLMQKPDAFGCKLGPST